MKILIGQPIHEEGLDQIKEVLKKNTGVDVVLFPEGYLTGKGVKDEACKLAKENGVIIVSSYKVDGQEKAFIADKSGELIMNKNKAEKDFQSRLVEPLNTKVHGKNIGYILCMEILKGTRDFESAKGELDFITHPIGVGMFSDEQFELWIGEARKMAAKFKTKIMGTSHADGSYRNCGISIPIAYCIDENGEDIFISRDDTRTRIVDLEKKTWEIV